MPGCPKLVEHFARRWTVPCACVAVLLGLLVGVASADIVRPPGWHVLQTWRQPQGLPQNMVLALFQTTDGYVWLGTKGGVARFDGDRFTVFDDSNKDNLRENEVWALGEGDDGSVWIGTFGGGVSRYHQGRMSVLTTRDGLVYDYVTSICNDRKGSLWIGTERGLSRYREGRFQTYTAEQGLPRNSVRSLHVGPGGTLWVGLDKGALAVLRGERFEAVTTGPQPVSGIRRMYEDRRGALWLAASDGLYREKDGRRTRYTGSDGLSADAAHCVLAGPDDTIWVGTLAGIDRIRYGEGDAFTIENVIPIPNIESVLADREGSLWVGTGSNGLSRLRAGYFTSLTTNDGLASPYVSCVLDDPNGNVWVGTQAGLQRLRDGQLTLTGADAGLPPRIVFSMMQDRSGVLWVGTDVGLYYAPVASECPGARCAPRFKPLEAKGLPVLSARALYEDAEGALWIGLSQDGLVRYHKGVFQHFTTKDGLAGNFLRALKGDRDGNLWIGARGGGLTRWRDGRFTVFGVKDGLVNDSVQALLVDSRGSLWIGTRQGVNRLRDGKLVTLTVANGLLANYIYSFLEDGRGNMWMTCAKGIFRVSQAELDDLADGKIRTVVSIVYGQEHGLASTVPVVGHQPMSWRSRDGRLWFATNQALSVVDPVQLQTNPVPPPVHIEYLKVDGHTVALPHPGTFPPGQGNLEIRYTALSFLAPERMRFKYRLEGYDRDWIDAGTRRVAYYTNIPPRHYRFRVVACNSDGVWNEEGESLELALAPHFYQTYWFYALCIAGVGLVGAGTQRWRLRRLQASERRLQARVQEALADIKMLRGLLPICAGCRKIRDDTGYWNQMEAYIREHSEAEFSHGMCPDCMKRLYPEYCGSHPGEDH